MPRLAHNASTDLVVPHLDEYVTHLNRQALTKRGRPLAPETVRAVRTRLRTCVARLPDGAELLAVLADRSMSEALIDRLFADLSQGSVRNTVTNLRQYQDWCNERGYLADGVLTRSDVPTY